MTCLYPECNRREEFGCTCHGVWWCGEHIDNHYEAMRIRKKEEKQSDCGCTSGGCGCQE